MPTRRSFMQLCAAAMASMGLKVEAKESPVSYAKEADELLNKLAGAAPRDTLVNILRTEHTYTRKVRKGGWLHDETHLVGEIAPLTLPGETLTKGPHLQCVAFSSSHDGSLWVEQEMTLRMLPDDGRIRYIERIYATTPGGFEGEPKMREVDPYADRRNIPSWGEYLRIAKWNYKSGAAVPRLETA
jgi:hypothetical protein